MERTRRRAFLADVGRGMLVASVGATLTQELGLVPTVLASDSHEVLTFGAMEPMVDLMQGTPADQLLPLIVERIKAGADLRELVASGALANARAFGGQDYDGYHALMALAPSYHMAMELDGPGRALPVLKVLYRNTAHMHDQGGCEHETLHPVGGLSDSADRPSAEALRDAVRRQDMDAAERGFATIAQGPLDEAYNDLLYLVHDNTDVHRVVLAWRAWALLDLTGQEHAHTLLRQSVRYCVDAEDGIKKHGLAEPLRALLPKLMEDRGLAARPAGDKRPDDAWVDQLAQSIYASGRTKAAEEVAAALADGVSPEVVGEALSLAANRLVLHDPGREKDDSPAKPKGSVHGASYGVHASDAANAWRNIARVSNARNTMASLIVGAYHTAGQYATMNAKAYPLAEQLESVRDVAQGALLTETDSAIQAGDQPRACALVHRHGELGGESAPVIDLMRKYAISEDGALHAEKYYRTVTEEFATTRPAFRWRQLAALARVTASEHGHPAPGIEQARELLGV